MTLRKNAIRHVPTYDSVFFNVSSTLCFKHCLRVARMAHRSNTWPLCPRLLSHKRAKGARSSRTKLSNSFLFI